MVCRQRQLEEERQLKLKQLSEARERKKREAEENKLRRVQLADSCAFFKSNVTRIKEKNIFFSINSMFFLKTE